ncbi:hypothetical protein HQ544_01985 [Candidatus Falkowbacteria bacterium]|nr:hypothetical protein [Candidatus Falkowbacteria bacterium]
MIENNKYEPGRLLETGEQDPKMRVVLDGFWEVLENLPEKFNIFGDDKIEVKNITNNKTVQFDEIELSDWWHGGRQNFEREIINRLKT